MRIKVEKTCKGECLNICPKNIDVRVASFYCLNMCEYFVARKIQNEREEIICNYGVEENVK